MDPDRTAAMRRAAVTAGVSSALLGAGWMAVRGFRLSFIFCDGSCSPQDRNRSEGGQLLMLGALVILLATPVVTRLALRRPPSAARGAGAWTVGLFVGMYAVIVGNRFGGWVENVGIFITIAATVGVLVPPRSGKWFAGAVLGAFVAAMFGDVPLPGVGLALLVLSVGALSGAETSEAVEPVSPLALD